MFQFNKNSSTGNVTGIWILDSIIENDAVKLFLVTALIYLITRCCFPLKGEKKEYEYEKEESGSEDEISESGSESEVSGSGERPKLPNPDKEARKRKAKKASKDGDKELANDNFKSAIEHFKKAVKFDENPLQHIRIAECYAHIEEWDQVLSSANKAVELYNRKK